MRSGVDDGADVTRRILLAMAAMAPALAAAGMASAADSAPAAVAELPPDLAKAVKDHEQAAIRNDVAALGEIVAGDYLLVNSDASIQNKESYLADFELPGFKLDPYVMEQLMLKVWGNTALTGGLLHLSWTQDGKRQKRLLRIANIWTKHDDGHWRMTYTQLTRVPQ